MNVKGLLAAGMVALVGAGSILAQLAPARAVLPPAVKATIDKAYPDNTVISTQRELRNGVDVYTVVFQTKLGAKMKAVAAYDGTLMSVAARVDPDAMPEAVKRGIGREIPDCTIIDALKYQTTRVALNGQVVKLAAPQVQYEVMVQSDLGISVLMFQDSGKLIRKEGA
ncbi:MAG: hypothetical protein LLG01_03625 [Planctomycetaceae bacterium]|nr:hypothetical protein [Planctomycetaceae bacterium]